MAIPKDPIILLSYVNTQLRDYYPNLSELCRSLDIEEAGLVDTLKRINYEYDKEHNRFV